MFLYAFNRRYAHCYAWSYAGRECSLCIESLPCSLLAGSKCCCTHWIVALLSAMSCRVQMVNVHVYMQWLQCSPLCHVVPRSWVSLYSFNRGYAHCNVVPPAGRKCSCTDSIVATHCHVVSYTGREYSVLVRIQSLLCSMLCWAARSMWVFLYAIQSLLCSLLCRVVRRK